MARIIVGADENAGDVAARLLELADHQNDVQTRTDGPQLAFEVPDKVYEAYVGKGKAKRSPAEQRANAEDDAAAKRAAADPDAIVSDDELPAGAAVVEPGEGDDLSGEIQGDELPAGAVNADPPANGEFPNDGQGGEPDGDQADAEQEEQPKPRKRTSRSRAAKSTPAAAGADK